jgi:glyoxylase-like metal-dependent hydrolase (beta-lactamase superfamily II)
MSPKRVGSGTGASSSAIRCGCPSEDGSFGALTRRSWSTREAVSGHDRRSWEVYFLDSLRALGADPPDVTDVLLSHLHLDHIGWTTLDGRPTFPNARYAMPRTEQDHYLVPEYEPLAVEHELFNPEDAVDVRLAPIAETARTFDSDGELMPNIEARGIPGHSPGQYAFVLRSNGEEGWLVADLAHGQYELLEDDWRDLGDSDPDLALATKARVVEELVARRLPFAGGHFGWGTLEERDGVRQWCTAEHQATPRA